MIKRKSVIHFILALFIFISFQAYADETYVRGKILHFLKNPDLTSKAKSYEFFDDGVLIVKDNKIVRVGSFQALEKTIPANAHITWYKNGLIMPGFIDTHIHYPQLDMIAANSGGHLLQWLNKYTFPFEKKLSDPKYAQDVAQFFIDELLRNGTTTAMIFATRYPKAVDALFDAAEQKHMRIITGKVMADRNLPDYLIESPEHANLRPTVIKSSISF